MGKTANRSASDYGGRQPARRRVSCHHGEPRLCFRRSHRDALWMVELGTPINGSTKIDEYLINDHWGILLTPVIDAAASNT